jgi:hypothetical protein
MGVIQYRYIQKTSHCTAEVILLCVLAITDRELMISTMLFVATDSRDSSVSTATGYEFDSRQGARDVCLLRGVQTGSGTDQLPIKLSSGALARRMKQPERESDS